MLLGLLSPFYPSIPLTEVLLEVPNGSGRLRPRL